MSLRLCSLFLLLSLVSLSLGAVRCLVGVQTTPGMIQPFQEVNCPNADFCFTSTVQRRKKSDRSTTVTQECGEPGKCFETGCDGPTHERRCCCAGDFCNSSNGLYLGGSAAIVAIIYGLVH